jgi:di/tricarboxylate transporter
VYLLLFAFTIAIVFRGVPYQLGLIVIPLALLILDRQALLQVDYGLLFTFVFFFIFAGNMARIDAVRDFFSMLLDRNTLVVSAFSCQFISNVPTAVLLSQFTDNYRELLLGVNIGGVGTLISSLASLITFREYSKQDPGHTFRYILKFSAFNFAFLGILILVCSVI